MAAHIHTNEVVAALGRASGTQFEAFFKEFFAAVGGESFIPLGGTHDGGADAFVGEALYEGGRAKTFYQASIEADHRSKIRRTIRRLMEFGRSPRTLIYATNRIISKLDVDENDLTDELNVIIRIRDGAWIANNINRDQQTQAAYRNHLAHCVAELSRGATARQNVKLGNGDNVPACVFLSYEVDHARGHGSLLESVIDSLIIWGLEGTDPDKDKFLTRDELRSKILGTFPFSKQYINASLDHRLAALSSKQNPSGRGIRAHRKVGKYCLPFETRRAVSAEHADIEALVYRVKEQLREAAIAQWPSSLSTDAVDAVIDIVMAALEDAFRNEGLKVGLIASGRDDAPELTAISDYVDNQIISSSMPPSEAVEARTVCISLMRKLFYESTPQQRNFLQTLSRTYSLLFTLKYEPRIVEYFNGMRSDFTLYLGSDILVRALSEANLADSDRTTENMLAVLRQAGSDLILTEPSLDEVWTHIISSDTEYNNSYMAMEKYLTLDSASQINRILIRSYFYGKFSPAPGIKPPAGWRDYLDRFCNYNELRRPGGKDSLRTYLCQRFGLKFEDSESARRAVDSQQLQELTKRFIPLKNKEIMAENDALMILLVYAKRAQNQERYKGNPFGFSTWWLTQESRIQSLIKDLVTNRGGKCILRPEFLMYYISMSPKMADVDSTYHATFPSLYGVKLGKRVKQEVLDDVMKRASKYMKYDDARVIAELEAFSNRLKSDQAREYESSRGENGANF